MTTYDIERVAARLCEATDPGGEPFAQRVPGEQELHLYAVRAVVTALEDLGYCLREDCGLFPRREGSGAAVLRGD